jgi:site-specific recombinase XerD
MHFSTKYYELYDTLVEKYYSETECRYRLGLLCLLIIIRNGLRATESVIAVEEFLKQSSRVILIKSLKGGNYRYVVFPEEVSLLDLYELKQCYDRLDKYLIRNVAYRRIKTNPHSLRVLYINALHEQGLPVDEIAKIIGHVDKKNTEIYIERAVSVRR